MSSNQIVRVLIFGRVGQVGTALAELLPGRAQTLFLDQPEIDLSIPGDVRKPILEFQPAVVINATAYTAVDKAESEPEVAHAINATAPGLMAGTCEEIGAAFVHYSTDYVFDGSAGRPYTENAGVAPRSVYGRTKLAGERAVMAATDRYVILRTAWLYSHVGHNFLRTMLRLAETQSSVRVVADQTGSPTYAWDLAQATVTVVNALATGRDDAYGLYHATNAGVTTWHGFASRIFQLAGHENMQVEPITTDEYPTPAPRPAYSVLSCEHLAEVFSLRLPNWEDAAARCIEVLCSRTATGRGR